MLHLESPAAFADAALAQNDYLITAPEGIHYHRPFFESDPHIPNLGHGLKFVHVTEARL